MDKGLAKVENPQMRRAGSSRRQIAQTLNTAYANGLISHDTLAHRLDRALGSGLIDSRRIIGDLRLPARRVTRLQTAVARWRAALSRFASSSGSSAEPPLLLALDWSGEVTELCIGRHHSCDVILSSELVSRRHARLFYRDGSWFIQDLGSTNGTLVNGSQIGRCRLYPGDEVVLGPDRLRID